MKSFSRKKLIFFLFLLKLNIDCGYTLELPQQGGSKEYPQSMFWRKKKNKKNWYCIPQFYNIKVGYKGVFISRTCFREAEIRQDSYQLDYSLFNFKAISHCIVWLNSTFIQSFKYVDKNGTATQFLDGSNRFYTLIPHDFGMKKPPMLDTADIIKVTVIFNNIKYCINKEFCILDHNHVSVGERTVL